MQKPSPARSGNESISSIFDFREILLRYAGLSEAANVNASGDAVNELFALSGSDNKELASACLARKNQRRLEFHQSLVRGEFLDMISEFAEAESGRQRILELAIELASGVNDSVTADSLTRLMSEPRYQSIQPAQTTLPLSRTHSASSSV